MTLRWRLFPKYATLIIALVGGMLVASGVLSVYFSYRENQEHLIALQLEKAQSAATRIEQYIRDIEHQLGWTALPQVGAGGNPVEQRRFEYLKLLRQVPAITEVAWIDNTGREKLKVSRLAMDVSGADANFLQDPKFREAKGGKTWYSPVYFRKETEPYMTISRPAGGGSGVTVAEVNLKFVWEVVSKIKVGQAGLAFVVNSSGTLIAHPDISLVLQKTDLTKLSQVAALAAAGGAAQEESATHIARDLKGVEVLTANAPIPTLNWTVFVELPLAEAFKPMYDSIRRMGILLLAGLAISVLASFFLARIMVRPINALQQGAARIGAGELDQKIVVKSGDELESLADQFNVMTARLADSYGGLERKVEERTQELTETIKQQTATSDVLRIISGSLTDTQPVFDAIVKNCGNLFEGSRVVLWLIGENRLHARAGTDEAGAGRETPIDRESAIGACVLDGQLVHVPDLERAAEHYPRARQLGLKFGYNSGIFAPLLRDGRATGAISVLRREAGAFSDKEAALLKTFADQAVIAIENVRLFNETNEALEKQTAIAEILRVISSSPTDTQPVFDAIVTSCQRLFQGRAVGFLQPRNGMLENAAFADDGTVGDSRPGYLKPWPLDRDSASGACILDARVVNIGDTTAAQNEFPRMKDLALALGYHSALFVPLLRDGKASGAIAILRATTGEFTEQQVALAKTFADQAMIAIENVRLFNEIQETGRQLEIASKHKSEFLANMSHELRTPLNAIIGFSEVLLEKMFGEMNEKQEDYLKDIHSSGQHLLSLINDILDLSKVEAGRMELNTGKFDLPSAIDNALTLIRERALRHSIALSAQVDPQLGELNADERKLKQILLNLLSNAVKFTPEGGSIVVSARPVDGMVEIAVKDTGVGIAPEDQAAVFEEFKQVGTDYTRKAEGTGLGLSLARKFVELHGGRMWLQSEPGKGSTFAFTIPLQITVGGEIAVPA